MATCQITGHPGSYGLGIRIAFYLQWFALIISCWLSEGDALNLKFLNALTIAATSVGLAINMSILQPVEIYVVLLLVCATLYIQVPVFLWRVVTCCRPWWDTERWNRLRMGWLFRTGMALLLGTLLGVQIWFWCTGVHERPVGAGDSVCRQYAFLFGQVPLDSPAVTAANIFIHISILIVGTWKFCEWVGMFDECQWHRAKKRRRWRITNNRIVFLQQLRTFSDLIATAIIVMAVELVISWNHISGVSDLSSAAQLIPPVVSGAYFLRSIYVWMAEPPAESHYLDVSYFTGGSAETGSYTITSNGNMAYVDAEDWVGQRHHPGHRHRGHDGHRHHHRRRRNSHASPGMAYEPQQPVASPEGPAAPGGDGRQATVVDAPDETNAAENPVAEPEAAAHPPSQAGAAE